jgi:two-component system, sensor histidine kinase and response regulator
MLGGVLVVDDSAETRALTAEMLAAEGIAATMATTGAEALAAFPTARPECVLLDVGLPDMDGVTVCERIRALPGGDHVAIVFVTARRDVDTFDRALRAGGDDFLTKPFRPAELVIRIQTAGRLRRMTFERGALSLELKRQRDELQRVQLQREQLAEFLVHDLKNPVHSIALLSSRVMSLVAADAPARDVAQKIREEVRALLRMITNLLDLTKSQERHLVPVRAPVDVRELVAAAIGDLQARAAAANLTVHADVDVELANLDRDLIVRVLANLLDNAIRHAPEHTVVTVAARRIAGGIACSVADAGPGVPPELRAILFERFASAGPRGSHGLGLAFCRAAVEAHGGRIWVEDGAPTMFSFEIPDAR